MKKTLVLAIGTAVAAFFLTTGGPALALTDAHKTVFTLASNGDCSACHKPHKAAGSERLFPLAPSSGAVANFGFIGAFCAENCHGGVAAYPGANANATALYGATGIGGGPTGIAPAAHGLGHTIANRPANTVIPTTLPYGNGANGVDARGNAGFECTTCHNPHKNTTLDTSEALLTLDIDALCDECHTARGAGDGTWAGYGDTNTLGTHPVGTNVTGDNDVAGNSPIDIGVGVAAGASFFDDDYGAASGAHNLGGHLINGATTTGVTCVTCHGVHGIQPDAGAAISPTEDLLVIAQGVQGTAEPAYRANGAGDTGNALCQGCHAYLVLAANSWDPGGTAFSHPSSGKFATMDAGVGALATLSAAAQTWPFGSSTSAGTMDVGVICESCHAPHPTQGNAGTGYGALANSHMLRAQENTICNDCHTSQMANHHPIGAMPAAYADAAIAGADGNAANLSCADCHAGSAGAHNWASATGIAINPLWEPLDNGRAADLASHGASGASYVANTSKECIDCHIGGTNAANPTSNTVQGLLQVTGIGTHYLGASANTAGTNGDLSLGTFGITGSTIAFNPFTANWPATGWSRFGGTAATAYVMVCESCHDLEPRRNDSWALLLRNQVEDEAIGVSNLCTGCHGLRPGGASIHPLTNDTISRAVDDASRATKTLLTTGTTYANAVGAPNSAEYPAADMTNCDSCHQVHMAATASGTYILEYNTGAGTGLASVTVMTKVIANQRARGPGSQAYFSRLATFACSSSRAFGLGL